MAKRVQTLLLLAARQREEIAREAERLEPLVAGHANVLSRDLEAGDDLAALEFDLAVVIGGDGSILRAAHQMARHQRPVVGVNLGKLGFLADLSPAEFVEQLPAIAAGNYEVTHHLMYECTVLSRPHSILTESCSAATIGTTQCAVHDAVDITTSSPARLP